MTEPSDGRVESVNIGQEREITHGGRLVRTGIFKTPTTATQKVEGVHIGNDVQSDTDAHGGEHKAVYAYAAEDAEWWSGELGREIPPGFFGENLTTRGIDVTRAQVGDRWSVGTTVLEVSEPRVPCFKLGIASGIPRFQQTFSRADRPGAYLRIVEPGELTVGDGIAIDPTNEPTITVGQIALTYHRDHGAARQFAEIPRLSEPWKRWARDVLAKAAT